MKRALAIAAMLVGAASMSVPAYAAGTTQYGSVKMQWNIAVTMTALIHTNYNSSGANGGATATLLSNPAGTCGAGTGQADFLLDYGNVTVGGANSGCTYTNALSASVVTNDSTGVKVYQYLDAAPSDNAVFCAFQNPDVASLPVTPAASITQSARTAPGPAAASGTTCSSVAGNHGVQITQGTGGTLNNSGQAGGQASATPPVTQEYYSGATGGTVQWLGTTSSNSSALLAGEDIQVNFPANQAATGVQHNVVMTVQFVPN